MNLHLTNYSIQGKFPISIIVPTLNEEKYIEKCLNSIFCQSYPSNLIEIFVIDGGSVDRTVEIVNKLCSDHHNLFILKNNKKKQAAAFNIGIDNFTGELLIRLDAHCIYDSNYIHYCVNHHKISEYGNVGGVCIMKPSSHSNMSKIIELVNSSRFGLGGAAYRVGKKKTFTDSVPFGSFSKKVLSVIGKMNESLPRAEDIEYNARIRRAGFKVLFDPRIISYYYTLPNLKMFLNKMYSNGFAVGVLIRTSRNSISLRHIIPLTCLLALGLGALLSFFYPFYQKALMLIIFIYFMLDLISGIKKISILKVELIPIYMWVVCLTHLYYGISTVHGFIKGK